MTPEEIAVKLEISIEEAKALLEDDKKIDRGEDLFPLTKEQKKTEKEMRLAGKAPTVYNFTKRERKPNEIKRLLINKIADALRFDATSFEVTNPERQIDFEFQGVKYRIILSAPRK